MTRVWQRASWLGEASSRALKAFSRRFLSCRSLCVKRICCLFASHERSQENSRISNLAIDLAPFLRLLLGASSFAAFTRQRILILSELLLLLLAKGNICIVVFSLRSLGSGVSMRCSCRFLPSLVLVLLPLEPV